MPSHRDAYVPLGRAGTGGRRRSQGSGLPPPIIRSRWPRRLASRQSLARGHDYSGVRRHGKGTEVPLPRDRPPPSC